jgi:hypothetical protein
MRPRGSAHLASVVDAESEARRVPEKGAEVLHTRPSGPQEPVERCIVEQLRMTNYLTLVIEGTAVVFPQFLRPR